MLPRSGRVGTIYTSAAEVWDRSRPAHGAFYSTISLSVQDQVYLDLGGKGLSPCVTCRQLCQVIIQLYKPLLYTYRVRFFPPRCRLGDISRIPSAHADARSSRPVALKTQMKRVAK